MMSEAFGMTLTANRYRGGEEVPTSGNSVVVASCKATCSQAFCEARFSWLMALLASRSSSARFSFSPLVTSIARCHSRITSQGGDHQATILN